MGFDQMPMDAAPAPVQETNPAEKIEQLREELTKRQELQEVTEKCRDEAVRQSDAYSHRVQQFVADNPNRMLTREDELKLEQADYTLAENLAVEINTKAKELGIDAEQYTNRVAIVNQRESVGGLSDLLHENNLRMSQINSELAELEK